MVFKIRLLVTPYITYGYIFRQLCFFVLEFLIIFPILQGILYDEI